MAVFQKRPCENESDIDISYSNISIGLQGFSKIELSGELIDKPLEISVKSKSHCNLQLLQNNTGQYVLNIIGDDETAEQLCFTVRDGAIAVIMQSKGIIAGEVIVAS